MPTRDIRSPHQLTSVHLSLRAKDHLEGTKVAVFPRYCAELKVQTGSAAAGGHRGVATRKTTGDLTTRRGAGDPVRRAEWMTVLRYGHLRSAPVEVDVGLRTEWEPPTLRAALWVSTRHSWRLLDGFLPLRDEGNLQFLVVTARFDKNRGPELRERCRTFPGPAGSYCWAVTQIVDSLLPSRAVGVDAPPRPAEQEVCLS